MIETIDTQHILAYRLSAHHLLQKLLCSQLTKAAGACGIQNSPPGAWESAMYARVENCSIEKLQVELYERKTLVQAWSYRGVPVIFPTAQSHQFLTALLPFDQEPWIYTRGITLALDYLQLSFDELLAYLKEAILYLDDHTIKSKELLDQVLAELMYPMLSMDKQPLWIAPSMYGKPNKQTVGGAVVSFLLRPCSFSSLIVFGQRIDHSPTFTSFDRWIGKLPDSSTSGEQALVKAFLHCYGPSKASFLSTWLGCSEQQANRLWNTVSNDLQAVSVNGDIRYMLKEDMDALRHAPIDHMPLMLLGAHDPYLDAKDKELLLENKKLQRLVWRMVANPNVVLRNGQIIGIWTTKTQGKKLSVQLTHWEMLTSTEIQRLEELLQEYAQFKEVTLKDLNISLQSAIPLPM